MSIILDEEHITYLFNKIQNYEDDNKIRNFKNLLYFIEDSIKKYNCPGTNSFLSCIYINTWNDFLAYLKRNHQFLLEKTITSKITENSATQLQAIQDIQEKTKYWILNSIAEEHPFSSTVDTIDTVLELANETLFFPLSENQWVKDIVASNKEIRIYLSHFLADVNPYNLEEFFEL